MPRGDGTGPRGQGTRGGGGRGGGQGRMRDALGGREGECVCTKCGKRVAHERGVPCAQMKCPDCGAAMTRSAG